MKKNRKNINYISFGGLLSVFFLATGILIYFSGCKRKETPPPPPPAPPKIEVAAVNVFIENTASMDGYIRNHTEFHDALSNYLTAIKTTGVTHEIKFFFINNKIDTRGNDINDFINRLNITTLVQSARTIGASRGSTDISLLLEQVLQKTNSGEISILICDFIFSTGNNHIDDNRYLNIQQDRIKEIISSHLKVKDLALIVYQLESEFSGTYYNRIEQQIQINSSRPYYFWIIGNEKQISKLNENVDENSIKGNKVKNVYLLTKGNKTVEYAVAPNSGNFETDKKNPKTHIKKAKKETKGPERGKMKFVVNVDFSKLLIDQAYALHSENYRLSDNDFKIEVSKSGLRGNTHSIKVTSPIVKPSVLSIKLLSKVPDWIYQFNDDEGLDIQAEGAMKKTFGLKYLIEGIHEGFTQNDDFLTEIKIHINQN